jgi:CHAT domain-containing protein
VAASLHNLAALCVAQGAYGEARELTRRALEIWEAALGSDHPRVAASLNTLALVHMRQASYREAGPLLERAVAIYERQLGNAHPLVAASLSNLGALLAARGAHAEARPFLERALALTETHMRAQLSGLGAQQRLGFLRSTRRYLDDWVRFAPLVGLSGYPEVLRFRGLVARAEAAERRLARRATGDERRLQGGLQVAHRLAARLANEMPPASQAEARAGWQRRYAEATAEQERLALELSKRSVPLRGAIERLDLGLADVQAQLGPDAALVDLLRVGDRYLAWIVRATGEPVRLDVGAAEAIERACIDFVRALGAEARDASSVEARVSAGAALRSLAWAPVETALGAGVRRVVICPDAALAAVPFAALPGKEPGSTLLDSLALSFVSQAQDLVPWKDASPLGTGALLVGGVDYERADTTATESALLRDLPTLAVIDRAPRGGAFLSLPQTRVEAQALRGRLGPEGATLLLGTEATEDRLRAHVRGRRLLHVATHGFVREDLLAGLYVRKIQEAWLGADMERQLAAGHDPMLLSGLALAGANPREGANGDDGILTALEASYLDLDGVELVTLSACETAKGTAESGEGVQGLVSAFQMAGARSVLASLWKVDDEATRLLMEAVYERLLRQENPLSPADALREAALALRDRKEPDGTRRFAAPRYWAAFVAYGR